MTLRGTAFKSLGGILLLALATGVYSINHPEGFESHSSTNSSTTTKTANSQNNGVVHIEVHNSRLDLQLPTTKTFCIESAQTHRARVCSLLVCVRARTWLQREWRLAVL